MLLTVELRLTYEIWQGCNCKQPYTLLTKYRFEVNNYKSSRDAEVCTVNSARVYFFLVPFSQKISITSLKSKPFPISYELRFIYRYIILSDKSRRGRFRITAARAITIFRETRYKQFRSAYYFQNRGTLRIADSRHTAQTYAKCYERIEQTGRDQPCRL
jgi:hypothetical protein